MHELSIVDALIDQTRTEIENTGQTGRVLRLDLTIGRLSGVYCDSIRFAFDLLSKGTPLEGAELHITEPKASCLCHACDARVEIDEFVEQCPECGGGDVSINGGRQLLLQSIEIED